MSFQIRDLLIGIRLILYKNENLGQIPQPDLYEQGKSKCETVI